ncbi:MAG TPA: PIN domain-containing protein [Blastocatellia bacterium]
MSMYVTDMQALVFYANRNQRQLSRRAWEAFEQAENRQAFILIPAPALWEVSILERIGQIKLNTSYEEWTRDLFAHPCFDCVPLDVAIIAEARNCNFNNDIFDAAITATAIVKDLPLITRDNAITVSGLVEIYW